MSSSKSIPANILGALEEIAPFIEENPQAVVQQSPAVVEGAANAGGPLTGLAAIGDFFQRITQANTWIRIAEVVLGFGLIVVGLAQLASGTAAGKTALKAGKAAALL
jgi:hypothetical protein